MVKAEYIVYLYRFKTPVDFVSQHISKLVSNYKDLT